MPSTHGPDLLVQHYLIPLTIPGPDYQVDNHLYVKGERRMTELKDHISSMPNEATEATRAANSALPGSLPSSDKRDFEEVKRSFIGPLPDGASSRMRGVCPSGIWLAFRYV